MEEKTGVQVNKDHDGGKIAARRCGVLPFVFAVCAVTTVPGAPDWDTDVVQAAIAENLVRWKNDPSVNTEYTAYRVLHTGKALNMLALAAWFDNSESAMVNRILDHLRFVVAGGNEPCCRGTIAGWADNSLAQTIALARQTPPVWNGLTAIQQSRLDLLIRCLTIAGNYCQNSANNIHRCLYQTYDWRKGWNPNHQEGYVGVMAAAYVYFGGAGPVNAMLAAFDYDTYQQDLADAGFVNISTCWSASGKTLMESGGVDSGGGTTAGVRMPFTYQSNAGYGIVDYRPELLYRDLAMRMYKHTVVSGGCSGSCYIIDSTVSPYEGKSGMCYEFAAADAGGCRSSARYCYDGWCNNVLTAAGLQVFGLWGDAGMRDSIMERMQNGSGDLVYKLQHGYHGRSNGEFKDHTESSVENLGYRYVKQVYEKVVRAADDVTALKQAGRISAFTTRTGNAGRYDLAGRRLRRPVTGITCRVASRTSVRLEVCQ